MSELGPCVICGDTGYNLSCGGPTICPKCDCGHFDAATVWKQAKVIVALREELERSRGLLTLALHTENHSIPAQRAQDGETLLDWLNEQIVSEIYLDDGRLIDVRGNDVRAAIRTAVTSTECGGK